MSVQIGRGHDMGTRSRWGQVYSDTACFAQRFGMANMGLGAGRIKDDLDVRVFKDGLDPLVARSDAQRTRPSESLRGGIDACQQHQLHMPRLLEELVHQVAADIA